MDVLQVLFSLWTGNRCTAGLPEAIEKLTAEEQQEIRAYCENNERQAFDVGFKTAVQLWNQLDNTGGIMKCKKLLFICSLIIGATLDMSRR